jgi:hypothetical protein
MFGIVREWDWGRIDGVMDEEVGEEVLTKSDVVVCHVDMVRWFWGRGAKGTEKQPKGVNRRGQEGTFFSCACMCACMCAVCAHQRKNQIVFFACLLWVCFAMFAAIGHHSQLDVTRLVPRFKLLLGNRVDLVQRDVAVGVLPLLHVIVVQKLSPLRMQIRIVTVFDRGDVWGCVSHGS